MRVAPTFKAWKRACLGLQMLTYSLHPVLWLLHCEFTMQYVVTLCHTWLVQSPGSLQLSMAFSSQKFGWHHFLGFASSVFPWGCSHKRACCTWTDDWSLKFAASLAEQSTDLGVQLFYLSWPRHQLPHSARAAYGLAPMQLSPNLQPKLLLVVDRLI